MNKFDQIDSFDILNHYGVRACENAAKKRRHIKQDLLILISLEKTTKTTTSIYINI